MGGSSKAMSSVELGMFKSEHALFSSEFSELRPSEVRFQGPAWSQITEPPIPFAPLKCSEPCTWHVQQSDSQNPHRVNHRQSVAVSGRQSVHPEGSMQQPLHRLMERKCENDCHSVDQIQMQDVEEQGHPTKDH